MKTTAHTWAPSGRRGQANASDPAFQAFWLLRIGFTVAPIAFGLDKFFDVLVNWDGYLASEFTRWLPGDANQLMYVVGVIEIVAGVAVFLRPRFGGYLVAAWLAGIIVNLLMMADYYDIALRDFGLLLAALTLARLSAIYDPAPLLSRPPLLRRRGRVKAAEGARTPQLNHRS